MAYNKCPGCGRLNTVKEFPSSFSCLAQRCGWVRNKATSNNETIGEHFEKQRQWLWSKKQKQND